MNLESFVKHQQIILQMYEGAYSRDHEKQPRNFPSNMTLDQWMTDFQCWYDLNEELIHGYLEQQGQLGNKG